MIDMVCRIQQFFLKNTETGVLKITAATFVLMVVFGSVFFPAYVSAREIGDKTYSVGLRAGNLFEIDDIPVNSMPMVVCYVRHELDNSWSAVLSLDSFVFDIDDDEDFSGIHIAEDTEAFGKMSLITASVEYVLCQEIKSMPIQPYAQAGVGIGFVDFEIDEPDDTTAGRESGIDIDTDGHLEVVPTLSLGIRYAVRSRWFIDAGTRFDYHISHWTIKDRNSGREVHINHFNALGIYAGFGVDF